MNRKRTQKMDALYAQIPSANCKGLCAESCSFLGMTEGEAERLKKESGGIEPSLDANCDCVYLKDGRCSVYNARPIVCRLYGAAEDLRCPFGCEPDRMLSKAEGNAFLSKSTKIGGEVVFNHSPEQLADRLGVDLSGAPDKPYESRFKN